MEPIQNAILRGHPLDWILLLFFLLLFLFHTGYMLFFTLRVILHKNPPAGDPTSMSLLLTFKNEEGKLGENLAPLLENGQDQYEVVAVDNCSQDESMTVINACKEKYPHLRVSSLKQQVLFSEKMAQNIALKAARYEWVNVVPPSLDVTETNWLRELATHLNSGSQTVVNYSNVAPRPSFFNLLYRVEFFFQQLKSFGFIVNGRPFVLSQENIPFKKQQYFDAGGYRGKISEPFAKLELVINSFIQKEPVSLVLSSATALRKEEEITWKDYLELLKKEVNIRKFLPATSRFLLKVQEWAFLLFAPVAALVIFRIPAVWPIVAGAGICLIFCNLLIIKKLLSRLQEFKLFLPSFLIALMLPFIKMYFRMRYFRYGQKKEWKIGN